GGGHGRPRLCSVRYRRISGACASTSAWVSATSSGIGVPLFRGELADLVLELGDARLRRGEEVGGFVGAFTLAGRLRPRADRWWRGLQGALGVPLLQGLQVALKGADQVFL